jgi:peptidoglycan hydrolase-like protein with peptidoglycan-binding domain
MDFATTERIKNRSMVKSDRRDLIAIHTMEAPEGPQTAENVAKYFDNVRADSHWCGDNNSRVRVIPDDSIAWTLPGANSRSLNYELAGYAKQTPEDWTDVYSIDALEVAAYSCAEWVIKYGIPVRRLTDDQIRNGEKGFVGHVDVNRVYRESSHWDPGPSFPWSYFLDRVRVHVALLKGKVFETPTTLIPAPTWDNRGYSMEWIRAQQAKLVELGYPLVLDGKLGDHTRTATRNFQALHSLSIDGVPGPKTSRVMDQVLAMRENAKPDCTPIQRALRTTPDNQWGPTTDKHGDAVREASAWGGRDFPYGVKFTQRVVGTDDDGVWGRNSASAHDGTVIAVQNALKAMGFDAGPSDGRWGDRTEAAYQSARAACHI